MGHPGTTPAATPQRGCFYANVVRGSRRAIVRSLGTRRMSGCDSTINTLREESEGAGGFGAVEDVPRGEAGARCGS